MYRGNLLKPVTKGQTKKVKDFIAIYYMCIVFIRTVTYNLRLHSASLIRALGDTKRAAFLLLPKKHHFSAVKRLPT